MFSSRLWHWLPDETFNENCVISATVCNIKLGFTKPRYLKSKAVYGKRIPIPPLPNSATARNIRSAGMVTWSEPSCAVAFCSLLSLLRGGLLLQLGSWGEGSPKRGVGLGYVPTIFHYCHIFGILDGTLENKQSVRTGCWRIGKYALICLCFFLTVSKVMIIWFTYIPAISGELGPMLMSWLPYLEKKVTLGRGSWTMRRTTLKLDSKTSCFRFDRVPYYSI